MSIKKSKTGLKRDVLDKFYTDKSIVLNCYKNIKDNISINYEEDLIIEPSAGNGAFIDTIKKLSKNYKFYDIEPEHKEIEKQDFLSLDLSYIDHINAKLHIIGNPPFGRQSSLAIKFIKKSCLYCDSISFILPKSFKKDSLKKHFPLNFHLIYEEDLPINAFLIDNKETNVPSTFQIWIKKDIKRNMILKLTPSCYTFVKKTENPHIAFRRVGFYAGNIDINITDKSIQSHYFISFNDESDISDKLEKLKNIKFDFENTVGPKSISKQELIKEFNRVFL
jgi:hypothetical protein